jgi:peptidoglycan/xylan/chitin deacetylase (PgdA/CDA1 family)
MIGVAAPPSETQTVHEFFELFKTHWEPAVPGRRYDALVSSGSCSDAFDADVHLVYGSKEQPFDREVGVGIEQVDGPTDVSWRGTRLPIYTGAAILDGTPAGLSLTLDGRSIDHRRQCGQQVVWRIGYDLFREVAHLLTVGQPQRWASTPTLELHIEVLRTLLLESGIAFVEIPPRPLDHDFVCCLTHDVDFFGIRRHRFDRTLAGFIVRASAGTAADLVRGRRQMSEAIRNWTALLSLPLVFLNGIRDLWRPFDDYTRAESGLPSTFFLIPFKHQPGIAPDGTTNPVRAVAYDVTDIADEVRGAAARGSEIAVHGIDSWHDAGRGRAEIAQVASVTGRQPYGIRMHWLYFSERSARQLESAGFDYDSTCGYNDAVGYRAGTSQVFRLPGAERLMELPLTIMDTALLYRGRMNLSIDNALRVCRDIVAQARRLGGTLVINWHDRSLAPERLWGRCYEQLLKELLLNCRPWFATASDAVGWFRWRRSFRFSGDSSGKVTIEAAGNCPGGPSAVVFVYRPGRGSPPAVEALACDGVAPLTVLL